MLEQNLTKEDYKKIIEDLFNTFDINIEETIKNLNKIENNNKDEDIIILKN